MGLFEQNPCFHKADQQFLLPKSYEAASEDRKREI